MFIVVVGCFGQTVCVPVDDSLLGSPEVQRGMVIGKSSEPQ